LYIVVVLVLATCLALLACFCVSMFACLFVCGSVCLCVSMFACLFACLFVGKECSFAGKSSKGSQCPTSAMEGSMPAEFDVDALRMVGDYGHKGRSLIHMETVIFTDGKHKGDAFGATFHEDPGYIKYLKNRVLTSHSLQAFSNQDTH
jgi:hypothetical protein